MKRLNLLIPLSIYKAIKSRVKDNPLKYRSLTQFILIACQKLLEEK